MGVSVTASFSNADGSVNLRHLGRGVWSGTWRPVHPASAVTLTVTAFNVEGSTIQADQTVLTGSVREVGRTPVVTAGGLVQAASFAAGVPIAPGTLISVYGSNLADDVASPVTLPLPRELNGVEVLLGIGRSLCSSSARGS